MALADDIDNNIDTVQDYLDDLQTTIDGAVDTLNDLVSNIDTNYRLSYATVSSPSEIVPETPSDKPGAWESSLSGLSSFLQDTSVPSPVALSDISGISTPSFDDAPTAPSLSFPSAPSDFSGSTPDVPTITAPVIPAAPDYTMPTAPSLSTISIPDAPDFMDLPTFSGTAPADIDDPALPALVFDEDEYSSTLMTAAEAWLLDIVQNGGTGLAADVEQAMIDRALFRETEAFRENIENAADEFAASAFSRPPGALRAQIDKIRADLQNRTEDLSRKILEDQANLAQTNTHFALTESLRHEATLLQHFNAVQDRALRYAIAVVDVAKEVYNLKVAVYTARWDGYKAEANVFGELLRATVVEIDRYKALVDAELAKVEVDKAQVGLYQSQVSAIQMLADFYRTSLEGAKIQADIEALTLKTFEAEVQAFEAEISAKQLEYDAYKATIAGESEKVDAYRVQVDAFRASIDGARAKVDAERAVSDSQIAVDRLKLEEFGANADLYRAQVSSNAEVIRAAVAAYASENDVYRSEIERARTQNEVNKFNTELALKAAEWNQGQLNDTYRLQGTLLQKQIEAAIAGSSQAVSSLSNMGAAVASQINTIQQIASTEDVTE